jgi:hypothetical protein
MRAAAAKVWLPDRSTRRAALLTALRDTLVDVTGKPCNRIAADLASAFLGLGQDDRISEQSIKQKRLRGNKTKPK